LGCDDTRSEDWMIRDEENETICDDKDSAIRDEENETKRVTDVQ